MSVIKFRAWNTSTKKMGTPHTLWGASMGIYAGGGICDTGDLIEEGYLIPMQFTGFIDKNGNDIYEGDILSDYTDTDEGVKKSHHQVYFDQRNGWWAIDISFKQDFTTGLILSEELVDSDYFISGNIYEKQNDNKS